MKKVLLGITGSIVVCLLALNSCNKEAVYEASSPVAIQSKGGESEYPFYEYGTLKELEAYIDKFSKDVGVDIFGLSGSENLELLSLDADANANCFTDKLANSADPDGIMTSLKELADKINDYAEQGNEAAVLNSYNTMIDMVYCNTGEDRPDSAAEQFNIRLEKMQENIRAIEAGFPGLKKLEAEVRQECYALAFYYREMKKSVEKGLYQGKCLNMYKDARNSATIAFLGQSLLCGCLGPIGGAVCMAQNTVTFYVAIRAAEIAFRNCVD